MDLQAMTLEKNNRFMKDYRAYTSKMQQYFHYHPFKETAKRYDDVMKQSYDRGQLADILTAMNKAWDAPEQTFNEIERLRNPKSVVVIGGQQAGLLSGPMYSLNKVISIIKYAKEKEKMLGVPVIPLFWIAGEDHDFDEINHTYVKYEDKLKKHTLNQYEPIKKSVEDYQIDDAETKRWLNKFVNTFQETKYTKEWFEETLHALKQSSTFVDFFARLIFRLFEEEGLVLFNSHDKRVRTYEKKYFKRMIQNHAEMTKNVIGKKQLLENEGYSSSLDIDESDVNIFYHNAHGERILLKYESNHFVGKNNEVSFSSDQIMEAIQTHPKNFSNNVVTRPIMQELLFPTLAFIAGDGEIAYWATLKSAFESMDLTMPPIVPRLSLTYVDDKLSKIAEIRQLDIPTIIEEGTTHVKQNWLMAQQPVALDPLFTMTKENIKKLYEPLEETLSSINIDLKRDVQKNLTRVYQQVDYLKKRAYKEMTLKYENEIKQFDELEHMLFPNGGLQERVFTPYILINQHGKAFIKELIHNKQLSFETNHYLVKLN